MKSILERGARADLVERLGRLSPDRKPAWGRMDAPQMVCHVSDAFRMALGDLAVRPRKLVLRYPLIKQLIIYVVPFPKGAPTAPELRARVPAEWGGEIETLRLLVDRFAERSMDDEWPAHPAFGRLSGRAWGALAYKHADHHFRQFGI